MRNAFTKTIQFARIVKYSGGDEALAGWACFKLHMYLADVYPEGVIPDCEDGEIEKECKWQGQPGQFMSAIYQAGLVKRYGSRLEFTDWWREAPDYAKKKVKRRKLAEASRLLPYPSTDEKTPDTCPPRVRHVSATCPPERSGDEQSRDEESGEKGAAAAVPTADAPSPAAAAAVVVADVLDALTEAGIGEPVRSELARSGLTAEHVRETHARLAAKGQGNGTLVNQLRVDGPQIRARTHAEAARRLNVLQREQISLWSDEAFEAHLRREWPALVKRLPQLAGCWPPGRAPDRAALCEFPSVIEALVKNRSPPVRGELTAES